MFVLNRRGESLPQNSMADISQSILILCSLRQGEIPYNPTLGLPHLGIIGSSFDTLEQERRIIEQRIRELLGQYEKRVTLTSVSMGNSKLSGKREVMITFTVESRIELNSVSVEI